jgi:hypothetical protein
VNREWLVYLVACWAWRSTSSSRTTTSSARPADQHRPALGFIATSSFQLKGDKIARERMMLAWC